MKFNRTYYNELKDKQSSLIPMPKLVIGCGKKHGLPFEYLMTDVVSGCLPLDKICYGNCSAAEYWFNKGYNFGKRVLNEFSEKDFIKDIDNLEKNQKWLRQGWVSDCSLSKKSWELIAEISSILHSKGIHLMIITKGFVMPGNNILKQLSENGVELRVSICAIDDQSQLEQRKKILLKYFELDGKSIPYLMSAKYSEQAFSLQQNDIVKWILDNNFIAAEHPLRISRDNEIINFLSKDGFFHPKFQDQYWFGRIFNDVANFKLPPPTCILPEYQLKYKNLADLGDNKISFLDIDMPTFNELKENDFISNENINKHATYDTKKNR